MKTYMHFCVRLVKYVSKQRMFRTKILEKMKNAFFSRVLRFFLGASKESESAVIVTLRIYF
jgi:hypothetical protein